MTRFRQHGFSLIAAIFILVVLASLGAFVLTISTTQQIGSVMDIQGARAYQAARAGVEWGLYQVQSTPAYSFGHASDPLPTDPNLRSCSTAAGSFTLPSTAVSLSAFTVTVSCTSYTDGSLGPSVFQLVSTACNQPTGGACPNTTTADSNYVERRLEISF